MRSRSTFSIAAALAVFLAGCGGCESSKLHTVYALATPSAQSIDFGSVYVGADVSQLLLITSSGTGALKISSVAVEGSGEFSVDANAESTVAPGTSLMLTVHFRPTAAGVVTGSLVVANDSANAQSISVSLSATGIADVDCASGGECEQGTFDPATGNCSYAPITGGCDAGSACLQNGQCVSGECLGQPVNCDDSNPCTNDSCDSVKGCVFSPVECDDAGPCSIGTCDTVLGCQYMPAPLGTPCGPITGCTNVPVCILGSCNMVTAPDGVPCNDGNLCTQDDVCEGGQCKGTRSTGPATIVTQLTTFGDPYDQAIVLTDGRLVFAHKLAGGAEMLVTIVGEVSGRLVAQSTETVPYSTLTAVAPGGVFFGVQEVSPDFVITIYLANPASGALEMHGTVELPADSIVSTAVTGIALYACDSTSENLFIVSFGDIDAPAIAKTMPTGSTSCGMALDPTSQRLFLLENGQTFGELTAFDVTVPFMPVQLGVVGTGFQPPVAANDGVVAVESASSPAGAVYLFDASTLSELLIINGAWSDPSESNFLALQDRLLYAGIQSSGVQIYDVSNPLMWQYLTDFDSNGSQPDIVGPGHLILANTDMTLHVYDVTQPPVFAANEVSGYAQGPLQTLTPVSWGVFAESTTSSHLLDVTAPLSPEWAAGSVFAQPAQIVGLGSGGAAPLVTVDPARIDLAQRYADGAVYPLWVDASNPNMPTPVGLITTPQWMSSPDNGVAYMLAGNSITSLDFSPPPGFGFTPTSLSSVVLVPFAPGVEIDALILSADPYSSNIAVIGDTFNYNDQTLSFTALMLDMANPNAPRTLGQMIGMHEAQAIALRGSVLLTVEDSATTSTGGVLTDGDSIHVYDWVAAQSTFVPRTSLTLTNPQSILYFDGSTAFIGCPESLAVVDLSVTPPNLLGTVAMPETPLDAKVVGDALYVSTPATLNVVYPPCPGE